MDRRHLKALLVVLLALALRGARGVLRWDEVALAYAAYAQPWIDAMDAGRWREILHFQGLHPPLWPLLQGVMDLGWGAPAAWLGFGVLASTAAVALLAFGVGWEAGLILALDPFQLAYCAEVNNYPLAQLAVAALVVARRRGAPLAMALAAPLAALSHGLLMLPAAAGLLGLARPARRAGAAALAVTLLALGPGLAEILGDSGNFEQPTFEAGELLRGLWDKGGPWAALFLLAALEQPLVALILASILGLQAMGMAAVHQQPYWCLLGAPAAAAAGRYRGATLPLAALGLALALPVFAEGFREIEPRARGVDAALSGTAAGDALWLVSPALQPDDDKRATSEVLWHFSPFSAAAPWRGDFDYTDTRYGQPRWMGERVVHTTTDLDPEVVSQVVRAHHAAGRKVSFVLYDYTPADDYVGVLERALAPFPHRCAAVGEDRGLGQDRICEVEPAP